MRFIILLLFIASFACVTVSSTAQVNVTYRFQDFTTAPLAAKRITLTPLQPFADYSGAILSAQPLVRHTDTNGTYTFTNVVAGYSYRVQLDTSFNSVIRTNGFPTGLSGDVNATDYLGAWVGQVFAYFNPTNQSSFLTSTNPAAQGNLTVSENITATSLNILGQSTFVETPIIQSLSGFGEVIPILTDAGTLQATSVTSTELGYLDGVTSSVQTQLGAHTTSIAGKLAATNGIYTGSLNVQTNGAAVDHFLTVPDYYLIRWGTNGASARWNASHPGGGELEITAVGSISFNPGYGGLGGATAQLGSSLPSHETWNIQYDSNPNPATTAYTGPLGHSKLFTFTARYNPQAPGVTTSIIADEQAGIIYRALDTNGACSLQFLNPAPVWAGTYGTNGSLVGGTLQLEIFTNGNGLSGMLKRQLTTTTGSGTYSIDLETPSFQEFNIAANCTFTLATVKLTNSALERDIFIRPGLGTYTIAFPTNWVWMNDAGSVTPPTSIAASNVMRLQLTATANSAGTNIYARYSLGAYLPAADSDAAAFFTAASITDSTQKAAVNQLVLQLKAHSLWTKIDALYPFVGGDATKHSYNLKNPATFQITWAGSAVPTHNGNGVTGTASGYGSTGYTNSVHGQQNSVHLYVYNKTTLPVGTFLQGVSTTGGTKRQGLIVSGSNLMVNGLNNDDNSSGVGVSSDFRGSLMASRTSSTVENIYANGISAAGTTTATTGQLSYGMHLLARGFQGFPADTFCNANIAAASMGPGMTGSEVTQYFADILEFQTTLGRQ